MKLRPLHLVACCLLLASAAFAQQDHGYWRALSTTARSITGDIQFSEYKVTINFTSFTIAQIRTLTADENTAAFVDTRTTGTGNLYRLNIPGDKRFLHKNTMCGTEATQWMATYVDGKNLQVAFFSGDSMPLFTTDAIANSGKLCGTFSYMR